MDIIISLDKATESKAINGGGKFLGLSKLKPLLDKYNKLYNLDFQIPKTYAITLDTYDKYNIIKNGIPSEIINHAMQCLVACGGNVAVRSSADVEDNSQTTHSGKFASVLSVKNKKQMIAALEKVYASANNVPDSKMGIIIQSMIEAPQVAGVTYSQDFNGDPLIVTNWTHGHPANQLLVNEERGQLTKISKYYNDKKGNLPLFNFSELKRRNGLKTLYYSASFLNNQYMVPTYIKSLKASEYKYIAYLGALANHLEEDLGYPVDFEFAISSKGKINILQQRPYIMNNNYIVKQFSNGDWVGYDKNQPIILAEVFDIDDVSDNNSEEEMKQYQQQGKLKNKILLYKGKTCDGACFMYPDSRLFIAEAKLRIDASYRMQHEIYNHMGNNLREQGVAFLSTKNKEFQNLKTGDSIRIDLRTGNFQVYPAKKQQLNIADIIYAVKYSKMSKL